MQVNSITQLSTDLCVEFALLQVKPAMTLEMWTDRLDRIQSFFGPGIRAEVRLAFRPALQYRSVQVSLITHVFLSWLE